MEKKDVPGLYSSLGTSFSILEECLQNEVPHPDVLSKIPFLKSYPYTLSRPSFLGVEDDQFSGPFPSFLEPYFCSFLTTEGWLIPRAWAVAVVVLCCSKACRTILFS